MRHFIFIRQFEHLTSSIHFIVNAETLEEAIKLFAKDFIDPDVARDDLEAQDIDPSSYTEEQILLRSLLDYVDYITVSEVESKHLETPGSNWISHKITEVFKQTLNQLI